LHDDYGLHLGQGFLGDGHSLTPGPPHGRRRRRRRQLVAHSLMVLVWLLTAALCDGASRCRGVTWVQCVNSKRDETSLLTRYVERRRKKLVFGLYLNNTVCNMYYKAV